MVFVAPDSLQIGQDILESLDKRGVEYELADRLDPSLPDLDAVYMTRIQDEWDPVGESRAVDVSNYALNADRLARMKESAIIMHPLPRRTELEPSIDSDPRAKYWRQVRNGMWARAALIAHVFDRDGEIDRYYEDLVG